MIVERVTDDIDVGKVLALSGLERDGSAISVGKALETVRRHLGMKVGFISEFLDHERLLRHVSTSLEKAPIAIGQRLSMDAGYCKKVIEGEIPQLIADTRAIPFLNAIPETSLLPIGSHLSVPIIFSDGSVYGTFCCFSPEPNPSLNQRDLDVLRVVADLVAGQIEASVTERLRNATTLGNNINSAIAASEPNIVYQPVFDISKRRIVGSEALSRFSQLPYRTPDRWFDDAATVGVRTDLEIVAIRNALEGYRSVWASNPELYLAVNASAKTIADDDFLAVIGNAPLDRIILEITEHDRVDDYDQLTTVLAPLRARGVRIAVDDAGSGYASLRHILRVRPDVIKLDISLTRDVDTDPMRDALASAVVQFARQTNCTVLAEGIETEGEFAAMSRLRVQFGQGFLLARPMTTDALMELISMDDRLLKSERV